MYYVGYCFQYELYRNYLVSPLTYHNYVFILACSICLERIHLVDIDTLPDHLLHFTFATCHEKHVMYVKEESRAANSLTYDCIS